MSFWLEADTLNYFIFMLSKYYLLIYNICMVPTFKEDLEAAYCPCIPAVSIFLLKAVFFDRRPGML